MFTQATSSTRPTAPNSTHNVRFTCGATRPLSSGSAFAPHAAVPLNGSGYICCSRAPIARISARAWSTVTPGRRRATTENSCDIACVSSSGARVVIGTNTSAAPVSPANPSARRR